MTAEEMWKESGQQKCIRPDSIRSQKNMHGKKEKGITHPSPSLLSVQQERRCRPGEGDRSLEYWRNTHRRFFIEELCKDGLDFNEDMELVCEEFEVF